MGGEDCSVLLDADAAFLDPLADHAAAAEHAEVPARLRTMLEYAAHLHSDAAAREAGFTTVGGARALMQEGDAAAESAGNVGCGFYDVFYEGCGASAMCFYDALPCSEEAPFYDFYEASGLPGVMMKHAPVLEYEQGLAGVATPGARADKAAVTWEGFTQTGAELAPATAAGVVMTVPDMPESNSSVVLDVHTSGDVTPTLMVLGEGVVAPASEYTMVTDGVQLVVTRYAFNYAKSVLRVRFRAPTGMDMTNVSWGVAAVRLVTVVDNYAPVADHVQVRTLLNSLIEAL
jgi:hypothetical protein